MKLADVKREVEAHLEYHDTLMYAGKNTALIDCHRQPLDVAMTLLHQIETDLQLKPGSM